MQRLSNLWAKFGLTVVFFLMALAMVLGDQQSIIWIRSNLSLGEWLPEGAFFHLTHIRNTGAALGILQDYTFPLTIASFVGVGIILVYAFVICRRFPFLNNMISKAGLASILGGTIGNLIDRINLGYVTDFLGVGTFPAFNVADSSVTVGTAVFAGSLIYLVVKEKQGEIVISEKK